MSDTRNQCFFFVLFLVTVVIGQCNAKSPRRDDVWTSTRAADLVVTGIVKKSGVNVSLEVRESLKGGTIAAGSTVVFPHPPIPEFDFVHQLAFVFREGAAWVVFLKESTGDTLGLLDGWSYSLDEVAEAVRDVLALDATQGEDARCRMLVTLACTNKSISRSQAMLELSKYNKPEYLEFLSPMGDVDASLPTYIRLLGENHNDGVTPILLALLDTSKGQNLTDAMSALINKRPNEAAISKRIVDFLENPNPNVRQTAVFVLMRREYLDAFPYIGKRLDDTVARVRATALCWPWYAVNLAAHPEVESRIRQLAHNDPDADVRSNACAALVSARDLSSLYPLWFRSLFDKSERVRHRIALALLFEHNPLVVLLLVFWPSLVLLAASVLSVKRRLDGRSYGFLATMVVAGYLCGAVVGLLISRFRSNNPLN